MNRHVSALMLFAVASAASATLGAQEASQNTTPYQGTSNPPSDDTIVVTTTPQAKPPAGKQLNAPAPAAPAASPKTPAQ